MDEKLLESGSLYDEKHFRAESCENNVGKKLEKSYFDVLGLCCTSEIPLIERILNSLQGVNDFSVNIPTKTVIVIHDSMIVSQIQIVEALNRARLEANVKVYGAKNYKNKLPSPYAVASGVLLLLSFLQYAYKPLQWLAIGSVLAGITPILLRSVAAIRNISPDINVLMLIAIVGSLALGDYWEAATIVFLFTIAEWLESRANHKATSVMLALVNVVPQRAVLADTGEEVNANEVKLDFVLAVKAGETIPIDGIVVEGNCEVDEKILTGESFPVAKQKDSTVWASTINLNGYIKIRTTAVTEDCVVTRMAKLVEEAQTKKSRTQRLIDKGAKYYMPVIVALSASLALVPVVLNIEDKGKWYRLALVVLVSGCPCALLLSTPVAMFCALSRGATLGLLFKGAEYLETLAKIKVMAFDKTGTITRGEFVVADARSLEDDISLDTMLYWISSIESKSSHPMAAALINFAREHEIEPKPEQVENFQNFPGEGIYGEIEGQKLHIGSWKIAPRAGCSYSVSKIENFDMEGKSIGYVILESSLVGVFSLSDNCRMGAKKALDALKNLDIKTVMLTGDCHAAAKHAQVQLGGAMMSIHSELLPEDKARIVKELQQEGPTAMIGDGINDAPALATANIGISMGVSGSALATETGDVVLMSNNIQNIPKAVRISKRVRRKIIENVIISISAKAAIVVVAIAGHPLVWAAVLADVGTCLLVILNSMLILGGKPLHQRLCCRFIAPFSGHKQRDDTTDCDYQPCPTSDTESRTNCQLQSSSSKKCGSSNASSLCCDDNKCPVSTKVNGCKADRSEAAVNSRCCNKVSCASTPHRVQNSVQSNGDCENESKQEFRHDGAPSKTTCKNSSASSISYGKLPCGSDRKCCTRTPRNDASTQPVQASPCSKQQSSTTSSLLDFNGPKMDSVTSAKSCGAKCSKKCGKGRRTEDASSSAVSEIVTQ